MSDRQSTDLRVLEFVRFSPGADRVEIAEALRLPRPTVVSAVRRLVHTGELVDVDAEEGRSGRGRGRHLVRAAGPPAVVGVIRWRHGNLLAGLWSLGGGALFEATLDRPAPDAGPDGLATAIDILAERAATLAGHRLATVVISAPAPFLKGTGVPGGHASSRMPGGFLVAAPGDFDSALAQRYPLTFITDNDVNLAALGEQFATATPRDNFIYLELSEDGLGSALVVDGQLVRGARGYAGEIAHIQIDPDGPLCHCGGRGCLWIEVRDLAVVTSRQAYDEPIGFADLPRLSDDGDVRASRMLTDIGRALGKPLGHLCTFADPECVIVDTTIGPSIDHVLTGMRESFSVYAPPVISQNVALLKSELGATAEIRGALEIPRESARRGG